MACDGEAFVRLWRGFEGNPYGLALQAIDADLIDETFNRPRRGSENEIRMGVEIDAIGRPVGYWIWNPATFGTRPACGSATSSPPPRCSTSTTPSA